MLDNVIANMQGWVERASCKQDPSLFEATLSENPCSKRVKSAKAVCNGCPVFTECYNHIMTYPDDFNIWAGQLPAERRIEREQMRRIYGPAFGAR